MYVCLCNAYREAEILMVAHTGVWTAEEAYQRLGSGPRCGRCLPVAQGIINREIEKREGLRSSVGAPAGELASR